jgi:hypothetical protein
MDKVDILSALAEVALERGLSVYAFIWVEFPNLKMFLVLLKKIGFIKNKINTHYQYLHLLLNASCLV